MRILIVTIILIMAGGYACSQTPAPRQLSLDQALQMARRNDPLVKSARYQVQGTSALLKGSSLPQNPTLSLAHGVGQNTGGLDEDVLLSQVIPLGDKTRQLIHAARAANGAAVADLGSTLTNLDFEVYHAYYQALEADADMTLSSQALDTSKEFSKAATLQYQAGDVAQSNVLRSQIEVTRAEQALTAAQTNRANKYLALRNILGLPANEPLQLTDKLAFSPVSIKLDQLITTALSNRQEIQSAYEMEKRQEALLHEAKAQSQPDLFWEARHSNIDPGLSSGDSFRVGLLIPIFDFGTIKQDARAKEADVKAQREVLKETQRSVELEVETAYSNLLQAQKDVQSFENGRLDQARKLLDMAQTGYESGANSYLELLDAQQVYRSEEMNYTHALATYCVTKVALQKAVGGKLP